MTSCKRGVLFEINTAVQNADGITQGYLAGRAADVNMIGVDDGVRGSIVIDGQGDFAGFDEIGIAILAVGGADNHSDPLISLF